MNEYIAFFLLRVGLGLNILLHGLVRLGNARALFVNAIIREFEETSLPASVIKMTGNILPYLETTVGLMLVFGMATEGSLIAGCTLIFILLIGKSMVTDWATVTFQMIYILIYCILLFYLKYNTISVDATLFLKS
jgi:thiosulfate dehydrogenase (quinone) large subunit